MAKETAAPAVENITVTLKFDKDTKNARRFAEVPTPGQPPLLGTIYLPLWRVGNIQEVTVTVALPKAA